MLNTDSIRVYLADNTANDFALSTATAYDQNGDGNIEGTTEGPLRGGREEGRERGMCWRTGAGRQFLVLRAGPTRGQAAL